MQEPQRCLCFFLPRSTAHTLYTDFFALSSFAQKNFFCLEPSLELMCAVPNFFVFETQAHCVLKFPCFFGSARIHAGKSAKAVDSAAHPLANCTLILPLLHARGVQDACLTNGLALMAIWQDGNARVFCSLRSLEALFISNGYPDYGTRRRRRKATEASHASRPWKLSMKSIRGIYPWNVFMKAVAWNPSIEVGQKVLTAMSNQEVSGSPISELTLESIG
ncbi:MAG: hypothetical protein IJU76_13145 [Desulfovibrionaceae bacterium]|nr:hypothetical protein [Desulfovibrionaceae bacterium]